MCGESSDWGSCDESLLLKKWAMLALLPYYVKQGVSGQGQDSTEVSERNVLFWGLSGKVFFWGKRYVFGRGWDAHESVSLESSFWNLSVKVLFGRSALLRLCESCSLLPYYVKQGMFRLPRKCQLGKQRKFFFPLENFSESTQIFSVFITVNVNFIIGKDQHLHHHHHPHHHHHHHPHHHHHHHPLCNVRLAPMLQWRGSVKWRWINRNISTSFVQELPAN